MDRRWHLQAKLESILGSTNVYYQPPESIKMHYPCIVYMRDDIGITYANNRNYLAKTRYTVTLISRDAEDNTLDSLLQLQQCSYNRHYVSDGLYHDVVTLYY